MADDDNALEKPAQELTRGFVRGALEGIWDWIRAKKSENDPVRRVLILGPGGTGKTTLGRLLSNRLDWLDDRPGHYAESAALEYFGLVDDPDVEAVVAPGQEYRRPSTWPDLLAQVAVGEYRGVILMNAYGYHTFGTTSYKEHHLYRNSKSDFLRDYFADRRADEIRVLRQLVPHLAVCPRRVWLLSAVAKQDLWGSQQRAVEDHYRRGDYDSALAPVTAALGSRSFRHELAFVSLIIRNLETASGERLAACEEGYDMRRLTDSLRSLIAAFQGLQAWEEEP